MSGGENEKAGTVKKLGFIDSILGIMALLSYLLLLIMGFFRTGNVTLWYFAIIYIIVFGRFISPLFDRIDKRMPGECKFFDFFIQGVVGIILIISSYRAFIVDVNNIQLWFWIFVVSFVVFYGIDFIRNFIEKFKVKKTMIRNKKTNLSIRNIVHYAYICLLIVNIMYIFYDVKNTLHITNVKIPEKITITKLDGKSNREVLLKSREINNESLIKEIYGQIEGKELTNIRNIEKIRYLKKTSTGICYSIVPIYQDKGKDTASNTYFNYIYIYDNNYSTVAKHREKHSMLKGFLYDYEINLKQETIEKIISYYENRNKAPARQ